MEQINVTIQTEKGRIDKVLSEHLPNHSRSQIQQWLKEKHVTVNGETVPQITKLQQAMKLL